MLSMQGDTRRSFARRYRYRLGGAAGLPARRLLLLPHCDSDGARARFVEVRRCTKVIGRFGGETSAFRQRDGSGEAGPRS